MKLGAFSISLNVKDLSTSKQFYEKFGFTVLGGDMEQNYLIMKNENSLIGLFQGMLPSNVLTFNPGWDENGQNIESFDDVRKIQEHLKSAGVELDSEADVNTSGPASFMLTDPDGNVINIGKPPKFNFKMHSSRLRKVENKLVQEVMVRITHLEDSFYFVI